MKKTFTLLLAAVATLSLSAGAQSFQGKMLPLTKDVKVKTMKAPRIMDDELVTPPATATVETDWILTGSYYNNGNAFTNSNAISVAFDGNDVYVQGASYLCPTGWIKGTINGTTATFANGQYVGTYSTDNIYICGSNDGQALSDITFTYDATAHSLTLSNFFLENTSTTTISLYLYSSDIVIAKNITTPVPTNLIAEPTATTANVAWTENGEATNWNLRYRVQTQEPYNKLWDFEDEAQLEEDWMVIDADGDNYNWGYANSTQQVTNSGTGIMTSASYVSGSALTPDNWLITPAFTLGGNVSFYACGQDPSYASEVFAVYVCVGEPTSTDDFVKLGEDITATGTMTKYTFDLSDYEGEGRIAIRHYNVTDMFRLNIDDIAVEVPGGHWPNEWTVVENVTNPYTIEGLTPETAYEVEVQAVAEPLSDWSESAFFTTLPAENLMDEFYVVGTFNGWDQTEEGGRVQLVANEEGTEYTGEVTFAENDETKEFKVITPAEDGSWIWFGGVDENQVGFFLINEGLLGVDIDLIDGSNFRVEDADTYIVTVKAAADGTRAIAAPLVMTVTKKTPDAIETISTSKVDNNWYNLQGVKFNGKPSVPGIYINAGKKVIIK